MCPIFARNLRAQSAAKRNVARTVAKREQHKRFSGLPPEIPGQNLGLTAVCVPRSLGTCARSHLARQRMAGPSPSLRPHPPRITRELVKVCIKGIVSANLRAQSAAKRDVARTVAPHRSSFSAHLAFMVMGFVLVAVYPFCRPFLWVF